MLTTTGPYRSSDVVPTFHCSGLHCSRSQIGWKVRSHRSGIRTLCADLPVGSRMLRCHGILDGQPVPFVAMHLPVLLRDLLRQRTG